MPKFPLVLDLLSLSNRNTEENMNNQPNQNRIVESSGRSTASGATPRRRLSVGTQTVPSDFLQSSTPGVSDTESAASTTQTTTLAASSALVTSEAEDSKGVANSESEPASCSGKCNPDAESTGSSGWSTKKKVAVGATIGAVGAVVAAPIVIAAAGFGAGGVVAGSVAAGWQSSIGLVARRSLFASLQSAGVKGLAPITRAGVAAAGAAAGAAFAASAAAATSSRNSAAQGDPDSQNESENEVQGEPCQRCSNAPLEEIRLLDADDEAPQTCDASQVVYEWML